MPNSSQEIPMLEVELFCSIGDTAVLCSRGEDRPPRNIQSIVWNSLRYLSLIHCFLVIAVI